MISSTSQYGLTWLDIPETTDQADSGYTLAENSSKSYSSDDGKTGHIFIESDNYPAMRCLLPEWRGKINLIYTDPPYNTGSSTFTYEDSRFLRHLPDGTYAGKNDPVRHSIWLSFMQRRLILAQKLLAENGCIFISISDEEYCRLRLLCDEIFGENNYVNDFMYLHGKGKKDKWSRTMEQHTICYAKNKKQLAEFAVEEKTDWAVSNTDGDERGPWFSGSISFTEKRSNHNHRNYFTIVSPSGRKWTRQWLCSREEMGRLIAENRIYWGKEPAYNSVPRKKIFNGEWSLIIPRNIIDSADSTREAQHHLDGILGVKNVFINPKPVNLVEHLLAMTQMSDDAVVLDFFAGSGTTLEAVLHMNKRDKGSRKCILIQSPEKTTDSGFCTIADIAYERIRRIMTGYIDSSGKRIRGLGGSLAYYTLKTIPAKSSQFHEHISDNQ
ncbi:MAG: site-specific DNA-methyltransferase [Treponema sp.]